MAKVAINHQAPEFTLHDYRGNIVSLSHYRDKGPVLLVFNRGFM
jgi:peroxiredoxin